MARHYRSCHLCEAICGVVLQTEGARVVDVRGDPNDPLSRGFVCPKVVGLIDIHNDPDRLRMPLIRRHGRLVSASWSEALDLAGARLRQVRTAHGPDAIAVYQGNPTAHSLDLLSYGQLLYRTLGTRNLYSATSVDQLPHMLSSLLMFGHQLMLPVPDIDRTRYLLMLGANPVVSNGSLMTAPGFRRRATELRARGGMLVVIDPRRTETAALADRHHPIRPGTDALLLLGILHSLFARDLVNPGRLSSHVRGLDRLADIAARFAPERVAEPTGIGASDIERLAEELATADAAVCYGRLGVSVQRFGGLCSWLINAINIVTGNLDRPGGAMFTTPAVDLRAATARVGLTGSFDRYRSRVRSLPEFGGEYPTATLADEIETPGSGQVRALIVSAGNPVLSLANGARLDRLVADLEFMVSVDIYLNETSRHADVILPPTWALERDHYDLAFNLLATRNVAKYAEPVFPDRTGQLHDWEIMLELAVRLRAPTRALAGPMARLARILGARLPPKRWVALGLRTGPYGGGRGGLSLRRLRRHPSGLDLGPLASCLPGALYTADRCIDLVPAPYVADLDRVEETLREVRQPGALTLIGRRTLRSNNSWLHNSPRLIRGKPRCTLLIHPDDARARDLRGGDLVRVRSRVGEVVVACAISDEVCPGVVSLPHGFGHHRDGVRLSLASANAGVSANDLTDEQVVDQLSGTACLNGVPVTVAPLERGR